MRKYPFYMNRIRLYDMAKPYIGQLKFMALSTLPSLPNTDAFYDSSSFKGWVYPDGRELATSRFPDAATYFGTAYGSASSGKFKIPNFSDFFRPYIPNSATESMAATVPANEVLLAHGHPLPRLQLAGSLDVSLSVRSGGDNQWRGYNPPTNIPGQHGATLTSTK